jgi:hypothetical protein
MVAAYRGHGRIVSSLIRAGAAVDGQVGYCYPKTLCGNCRSSIIPRLLSSEHITGSLDPLDVGVETRTHGVRESVGSRRGQSRYKRGKNDAFAFLAIHASSTAVCVCVVPGHGSHVGIGGRPRRRSADFG